MNDDFYKSLYDYSKRRIDKLLARIELLKIEREILLQVIKDYKGEFLKNDTKGN
ncbi:MAG: hypothetical protein Q8K07_10460 [Methylicorpusculum sp.]|uniref:hypothetical protein n=1 Tax=Methylicorpusculum sp. TaxID=2713644 RepID=UPI00272F3637|nr:hypothetical protein [Methylicorpusculum sp.]MDP2202430.1 hypothetical protein [Methylicorpusculum sp.]